ncbi:MAG TPA: hypothetical protein VJT31_23150, partial [Rugosimonospora sp.]|nr:hypothetical protein [Rugosimonospora sp.]
YAMTAAPVRPDLRAGAAGYAAARAGDPVLALDLVSGSLLPGAVPFGPGGHALTTARVAGSAPRVWLDGDLYDRDRAYERELPGLVVGPGPLVALCRVGPAVAGQPSGVAPEVWLAALAGLRLGLSEALRERCMAYLGGRRTGGNATLLQQQMVKGTIADAVACHLEVRAVLDDPDALRGPGTAGRLHTLLTATDRRLVRLLGASGYATGGAGQVANVSALLADAYGAGEAGR